MAPGSGCYARLYRTIQIRAGAHTVTAAALPDELHDALEESLTASHISLS